MPTVYHSREIEHAILDIPVTGRHNFYTGVRQVSIKVRNRIFQRTNGFFDRQGFGHNPEAELLAFQTRLAVRDQRIEKILLRLVEETKVGAPWHVANDVDSGLPHLGCHRSHLPIPTWNRFA